MKIILTQLSEKDFSYIKEELQDGRFSLVNMRTFLTSTFVFSFIIVGIAFFWATQSPYWERLIHLFIIEGIFFLLHLLIILLCFTKSNMIQIILSFSTIFFIYKMILDPFIFLFLYFKGYGVYGLFAPITFISLILGAVTHIYLVLKEFYHVKAQKKNRKVKKRNHLSYYFIGCLFFIVSITGYVIKNNLLGSFEALFMFLVFTILYFVVLIGAVDYVLGAYCLIRFPSFRVHPPESSRQTKKRKRIKRNRKK